MPWFRDITNHIKIPEHTEDKALNLSIVQARVRRDPETAPILRGFYKLTIIHFPWSLQPEHCQTAQKPKPCHGT